MKLQVPNQKAVTDEKKTSPIKYTQKHLSPHLINAKSIQITTNLKAARKESMLKVLGSGQGFLGRYQDNAETR